MKSDTPTPWYKQFWPWFLISIPVISIILSMTMMHLATSGKDTLVIDDYYKEGKGINRQLVKYQEAKVRGIDTTLTFEPHSVQLNFKSGAPETGEALSLTFQHATLAEHDFSVMLVRDANGTYRATLDKPVDGKWRVLLKPIDDQWRISQTLTLPRKGPINFAP